MQGTTEVKDDEWLICVRRNAERFPTELLEESTLTEMQAVRRQAVK
ncbi:hypothetical protein PF007_g3667 [Phytophthora fragariae]|uniref:Uncharacterized protein n=2 Tax=Phytophthora TaxID=4783 RepID=A0A6A3M645_9STRA|nr:hypothetical protein PF003_g35076 [Phytophthora fragariae]KAE9358066.1 hypothetical protein PR003_g1487 [Phytophthora rubi]KAE9025868.1 hypothetical protein PF011_g2846 [Phytophthora fragariae]KAE9132595.1 hypothetical protein PF007_g3667 [Phytophthora fragariae]KAE9152858.1 hypothetical protein PF006_g2959 [Phytophthora fragariae]